MNLPQQFMIAFILAVPVCLTVNVWIHSATSLIMITAAREVKIENCLVPVHQCELKHVFIFVQYLKELVSFSYRFSCP